MIRPDVRFMLKQFCADNDRKMLYYGKLSITVKKVKSEIKPKEEDF